MPVRLRLSRQAGFRLQPGAVKVDRSTGFGNPWIVGKHGSHEECVRWHGQLLETGKVVPGTPLPPEEQLAHLNYVMANLHKILGADVACWCRRDLPCHADNYLRLSARFTCKDVK